VSRPLASKQRGMTLTELMVAIGIGLFLTVVVANVFLSSRRTFATTDGLSRMQENMRYAYNLMSRTVHLTGYKTAPNSVTSSVFAGPNFAVNGVDGGGTAPDALTVRYQGSSNGGGAADGTIVDCAGNHVAGGVMATNAFTIAAGANGANALFCNGAEILPDVENMQVLYGEDTNSDLVADRYVEVGSLGSLDSVVSVRIALLFRTPDLQAAALKDAVTYDLNGTIVGPFNDTRMRRVLLMNVNLRNRTP
jgi:type IV pilus assembly protein PilW